MTSWMLKCCSSKQSAVLCPFLWMVVMGSVVVAGDATCSHSHQTSANSLRAYSDVAEQTTRSNMADLIKRCSRILRPAMMLDE